jgi:probable HAF family extracellular repeat protein
MDTNDTQTSPHRGKAVVTAAVAATLSAASLVVAARAPASSATEPATVGAPAAASVLGVGTLNGGPLGVGSEVSASDPARLLMGSRGKDRRPADHSGAFLYRNGRYTPLDGVPGAPVTAHIGINNRGQIVGGYPVDGSTLLRGFVRDRRGDYDGFDAAAGAPDRVTTPWDVNDRGAIAGTYAVGSAADPDSAQFHGFVRSPGGAIRTVDVPGASITGANGINNRGAVVGTYVDADGRSHGFLLERGALTPIDPPRAAADAYPGTAQVQATDINDHGQIVGVYPDAKGRFHGFLYSNGRFTQLDPPRAAGNQNGFGATAAFGINNRGQVVGQYVDTKGVLHGYLWERKRGFETIDPPGGAANSCAEDTPIGRVCGTVAVDINDRGQILLPGPESGVFKGAGPG